MKTIYYTVQLHLDSSLSWNGLRTINVYRFEDNMIFLMAELECSSDDLGSNFSSDEEEIQDYLDTLGDEYEEVEMVQL